MSRPPATRAAATGALVVTLSLVAGACSSSSAPKVSPTRTLAAAKRHLDATPGVRIGLSTPTLPSGVNGLLRADGVGTHAPAFSGTIKVMVRGVVADASVVSVGSKVYAKLPFTTTFRAIDPATFGAPDPSNLMSARGGLSSLLTAARHVHEGTQVRQGSQVLSSFSGTVPGTAVAAVIPSASSTASFSSTFTVDDRQRLAKAVLTGPFYPRARAVTYTITFSGYGTTKKITAP